MFGFLSALKYEESIARIPLVLMTGDFTEEGLHFHWGSDSGEDTEALDYIGEQVARVLRGDACAAAGFDSRRKHCLTDTASSGGTFSRSEGNAESPGPAVTAGSSKYPSNLPLCMPYPVICPRLLIFAANGANDVGFSFALRRPHVPSWATMSFKS